MALFRSLQNERCKFLALGQTVASLVEEWKEIAAFIKVQTKLLHKALFRSGVTQKDLVLGLVQLKTPACSKRQID